ncbi:fibroleukin-like isoform X2 [Drosophila biarmipes]|uniref:fibroleukin-like isoform X2 n=1 Tax=Drosophila biarmipes TaxID=125945 RepID=UPI0021CC9644|nr:fibroleukin-like isoform X2 [Drosophila biarmipes]
MKSTLNIFVSVLLFKLIFFGGADAEQLEKLTYYLTGAVHNLLSYVKDREELIKDKGETINILSEKIKEKEGQLRNAQDQMDYKDGVIRDRNRQLNDQLINVRTLKEIIEKTESEVHKMNETIRDLLNQIEENNNLSNDKNEEIEDQIALEDEQDEEMETLTQNVEDLEDLIETKNTEINAKDKQIAYQGKRIADLLEKLETEANETSWFTIQKRFDGSENFNRNWADYKRGFGDARGEFFVGLDIIHAMTNSRPHELLVKVKALNGTGYYAHYDNFKIGNERQSFELKSLGKYSGTAGDSFAKTGPLPLKFSTVDRNNVRCSRTHGGGWWYYRCSDNMLNGKFYKDGHRNIGETYGIHWGTIQNHDWSISLPFAEMLIRPKRA